MHHRKITRCSKYGRHQTLFQRRIRFMNIDALYIKTFYYKTLRVYKLRNDQCFSFIIHSMKYLIISL